MYFLLVISAHHAQTKRLFDEVF